MLHRLFLMSLTAALTVGVTLPAFAQDEKEKEEDKKITVSDALSKIQSLASQMKFADALKVAEKGVEAHPKERRLLTAAAQLNHQVGIDTLENGDRKDANKYLFACAKHMRKLHKLADGKLQPQLANFYNVAIYNQACSLAVDGKKEQALKILAEAIDAGFDQLEVLEGDDDFKSVRDEKKFKEIVEKLREKKKIRT